MNFWSGRASTGEGRRSAAGSFGRAFQPETCPIMSCIDIGSSDLSYSAGLASADELFDWSATSLAPVQERRPARRYQATAGK